MTLQELFKANGISDEVITALVNGMKENKIYTAGEENLDIRYSKLKTNYDSLNSQYTEAQNLITELKKSNKGNEELQGKVTSYEAQIQSLQEELARKTLEAAIKVGLIEAKATDVDYLTFKLKEKGELALDENEKIKDWDDKIAGLKTQFPNHFESAGQKKIEEHKLPDGNPNGNGLTRTDLLKKPYAERVKFANENPETYAEIMKK